MHENLIGESQRCVNVGSEVRERRTHRRPVGGKIQRQVSGRHERRQRPRFNLDNNTLQCSKEKMKKKAT